MSGKRRGNGEGTIGKHPNGYWWARLRLPNGKRKAFYADTQQEVIRKLDEAKAALAAGASFDHEQLTVAQHSKEWLKVIKPTVAKNTYDSYESLLRLHVLPSLGRKRLGRLQTRDIQATYSSLLAEGMTPATLDNTHRAFHGCLEKAVQWGLILRNPSDFAVLPKVRHPEKPMLSECQVQQFLQAARDHRLEALFILALATGARSGELLGLRWSDVDLDEGVGHIRKSLKKTATGCELGDTKTIGSERIVEIGPATVKLLVRHRARQDAEAIALGAAWDKTWNLTFANRIGRPLNRANVLHREFRPLIEKAGLPQSLRFHDLRHIFASLALSKGMDIVRVAAMLGHSSPATTLRTYSHAIPGSGRTVAAALDSVIAG